MNLQSAIHVLVDFADGGLIAASVAVVGCREDRDNVALVTPIVAIHHKLMGTGNSCQTIRMVELLRDVLTERIAGTTRGDTPAASVVRVRPEQVADGTLVGHLLHAVQLTDLIKGIN